MLHIYEDNMILNYCNHIVVVCEKCHQLVVKVRESIKNNT